MFAKSLRPAVSLLLAFTLLLGIGYPVVLTGVARLAFPSQAAGSLVSAQGRVVGSRLIGHALIMAVIVAIAADHTREVHFLPAVKRSLTGVPAGMVGLEPDCRRSPERIPLLCTHAQPNPAGE